MSGCGSVDIFRNEMVCHPEPPAKDLAVIPKTQGPLLHSVEFTLERSEGLKMTNTYFDAACQQNQWMLK